ncbi:MAG: hypothetical protein Q7R47_04200 [Candidatus Diapherotrites archaeon]|nr:hypothetical protein [Candidatus Diapherotrites archaeon]
MNHKGIVFTLMTLILVLAILSLNTTISKSRSSLEPSPEVTRLREVSKIFRDIDRSLSELDLNGGKKSVAEKGLPFSYALRSQNRLLISQQIPTNPKVLSSYYDSIQGYRIFFEGLYADSNRGGIFVDINAITDLNWGSTTTNPHFLLSPSCTGYTVTSRGFLVGNSFQTCENAFDLSAIRRMDINVKIQDPSADFNFLVCNGGACAANPFDDANKLPFFSVNFVDNDCQGCDIVQKIVSGHYAVTSDYNVFLSCDSPACHSKGISLVFGPSLRVTSDWNRPVDVNLALDLNTLITGFRSLDANFTVVSPKFAIVRSSAPLSGS